MFGLEGSTKIVSIISTPALSTVAAGSILEEADLEEEGEGVKLMEINNSSEFGQTIKP